MKKLVLALSLLVGFTGRAQAAPITFHSGDGGDVLVSSVVAGAVTPIAKHAVWGDVSPAAGLAADTAKWISYANTGNGGIVAPNMVGARVPANATAHFRRTFNGSGDFNLWILADDTATVLLNGVEIFAAVAGQVDPCAPGGTGKPIGCVLADMGVYNTTLTSGLHTLDVYVYQTNASVFDTQYAASVPEPATMALVGLGLLGASIARRRKP